MGLETQCLLPGSQSSTGGDNSKPDTGVDKQKKPKVSQCLKMHFFCRYFFMNGYPKFDSFMIKSASYRKVAKIMHVTNLEIPL
jgi:hypothetical protein